MSKTLLIIDDDLELCEGLSEIFTQESFSVEACHDTASAFNLIHRKNFDVILLDIKLPGDGIELLKKLRNNPPKGKIFIISGAPDAQERLSREEVSRMVSGVIKKPFDIEEMIKKIRLLQVQKGSK